MSDSIQEIVDAALKINELHLEHSQSWINEVPKTFNLKKKQIRHICDGKQVEESFYTYVNSYCDDLAMVYLSDNFNDLALKANITSRIKNPDSRMYKILHYYDGKVQNGQVNINKCLNDLLGFRIGVHGFQHCEENIASLESTLANLKIKVHNSCKDNYLATHLYFSNGNNLYFPWELQIWNADDWHSNIKSHAEYKQYYTKWPQINKQLGIR